LILAVPCVTAPVLRSKVRVNDATAERAEEASALAGKKGKVISITSEVASRLITLS
jgi:hypothetical protein